MERQRAAVTELHETVVGTDAYRIADAGKLLVCRPTGDGMAIAFFSSVTAAVECAVDVAKRLRTSAHVRLRTGIHTGQVYGVNDAQGNPDIIGDGVNVAQRVMDCGNPDHILLSSAAADVLKKDPDWERHLKDLGVCTVKHGHVVHLYNLSGREFGNPGIPRSIRSMRLREMDLAARSRRALKVLAATIAVIAAVYGGVHFAPDAIEMYRDWREPSPIARLKRARELADQRSWQEATAIAEKVQNDKSASGEQKGEALYLIALAASQRGDSERYTIIVKTNEPMLKELGETNWAVKAIRAEKQMTELRKLVSSGNTQQAIRTATRLRRSGALAPEQKAEALLILASAQQKIGSQPAKNVAYQIASSFDAECKPLGEKHWTREKFELIKEATKPPPAGPGASDFLSKIRTTAGGSGSSAVIELGKQALAITGTGKLTPEEAAEVHFRMAQAYLDGGEHDNALAEIGRIGGAYRLPETYRSDYRDLVIDTTMSAAESAANAANYSVAATRAASVINLLMNPRPDIGNVETWDMIAKAYAIRTRSAFRLKQSKRALNVVQEFEQRCQAYYQANPSNEWVDEIIQIRDEIRSLQSTPTPPDTGAGDPADTPQ
jgi:hypothetical protein